MISEQDATSRNSTHSPSNDDFPTKNSDVRASNADKLPRPGQCRCCGGRRLLTWPSLYGPWTLRGGIRLSEPINILMPQAWKLAGFLRPIILRHLKAPADTPQPPTFVSDSLSSRCFNSHYSLHRRFLAIKFVTFVFSPNRMSRFSFRNRTWYSARAPASLPIWFPAGGYCTSSCTNSCTATHPWLPLCALDESVNSIRLLKMSQHIWKTTVPSSDARWFMPRFCKHQSTNPSHTLGPNQKTLWWFISMVRICQCGGICMMLSTIWAARSSNSCGSMPFALTRATIERGGRKWKIYMSAW